MAFQWFDNSRILSHFSPLLVFLILAYRLVLVADRQFKISVPWILWVESYSSLVTSVRRRTCAVCTVLPKVILQWLPILSR